jgi:NAD-dependent DNA ligase
MINNNKKEKKMTKKTPTTTFCITGALEKYKRIDAIVEIHNKTNARFVSGVSNQTDYLISSRKDTNKAKRAKAFGTQVIDEAEMMAFIKAGNFPSKSLN